MFKRFTSPLRESARWVANPSFIYKVLIYTNCERSWIAFKNTFFFSLFFLTYFSRWNQVNIEIYSCSTHWAQSQYLFLCLWGNEARAAVVQTIIICAGSKKSHVSQFMSAAVAPSHGWFRIWNKLRNHFLCSAVIHLFFFPDTQTPTACFLSNWRDQQVRNNLPHFFHQLFFFYKLDFTVH